MQATSLQGFPLSNQQARLWSWHKESPVYQTLCAVEIGGLLDKEVFTRRVGRIIERNETLRTLFYTIPSMDVPLQVISEDGNWSCSEIDLGRVHAPDQLIATHTLFLSLQKHISDLQHGPLFHLWLCRLAADLHILLVSLPALCADGSSLRLLLHDLSVSTGDAQDEEVPQYADVSAWQEKMVKKDEAEIQRQYWDKIDLAQISTLHLPFGWIRGKGGHLAEPLGNSAFVPQMVAIPFQEKRTLPLQALAQQHGVSLSSWLLASWSVLLWRLSDEATFLVGVGCSGRNHEELTKALGPYMRFVPIAAHFEKDRSFEQFLVSIHRSLQEANRRQMYFTWGSFPDDGAPPFFPLSFEYDCWPHAFETGLSTWTLLERWSCSEPFVLKLSALQIGERLRLELHYDSRSLPMKQARSLAELFQTLLLSTIEQPQTLVGSLPLLQVDEQNRLLTALRAPTSPLPAQAWHQLFEAQVRRAPDQLAVRGQDEELTYQQLNSRANRLARALRRRGVGPNVLVSLCMKRSAQMLVGLLGILKAGAGYVPLDAESPPARLASQLLASQAVLLLMQQEIAPRPSDWLGVTLCLEDLEQEMAETLASDLPSESRGEDIASVISTSGSTGIPKGVMIRQASLVNYALALCERLEAEAGWSYATVSTLAADLGNTAIFCALVSGGCVHVLDYETFTSAEAMTRWVRKYPLDVLKIVPSHLSALLIGGDAEELRPRRALILGGEVLPPSLLERLRELQATSETRCQVYNHYGPTETTVGVLVNPLGVLDASVEQRSEWEQVPLGRPINNTQVYVLDRRMQLMPAGVTGELYVGGAGVSLGYVKLPEQTAERFVPHPWSTQPGERLYRTGDLVRYSEQGSLEFVGRRDRQVKLRGYRIELAEIEAVLCQHPQIRESVVVLREDVPSNELVSYVVTRQNIPISTAQVNEFLRQFLPAYMIPPVCVQLNTFPLTTNGKVDKQRLPKPEQKRPEREQERWDAPRSPMEEILLEIWKDLLGLPRLSVHDHFFQVGGHSLLATQVIARVQAMLQVTLPVRMLFDAPTVAAFAQRVEQARRLNEGRELPPLVRMARPTEVPLSFAQQRLWFLDQLEPESTVYLAARALRLSGKLSTKALEQSWQELVCRHESLRTTFESRTGQPVQVIHPVGARQGQAAASPYPTLPVIDLQTFGQEKREEVTRGLARAEAQRPMCLETGPLLRTSLLRQDAQEHVLLLTLHHILTDGWSNKVLVHEMTALYQANVKGLPSPLPPLPIQYADYALWQRVACGLAPQVQGEALSAELSYWRKQLANVLPLELPTDHPRLATHTYRGAHQSKALPEALGKRFLSLARKVGVTSFMLGLAAFQVLLMRHTGQTDIRVGIPVANRSRTEIEGIIGFFVNTLVVRTDLSGNPTFLEVLEQVREVCLQAYVNQDLPFEKLVEELQPERDLSRSPLCQMAFQLAQTTDVSQLFEGLRVELLGNNEASADYDLNVLMLETPHGLTCTAIYDRNLFEAGSICRLLEHLETLLEGIVQDPQARLSHLPLLASAERHQLRVEWNATQCDSTPDLCVHQLFEQQVERTPEAVAVVFEEQALTYAQLNARANQLARGLQGLGIGPEKAVGVFMQRSLHMVVGLLGIHKAGGALVPLDPDYPQEHLTDLVADAQIKVVLTHHLPAGTDQHVLAEHVQIVHLETDWKAIADLGQENPQTPLASLNLASIIYTSGSTGRPKGVMNTHRGLCNRLYWMQQAYPLTPEDRILQKTPLSFDVSLWEFFWPLLTGASMILAQPGGHQDPSYLRMLIVRQQVTVLHFVPSMLQAFLSDQPHLESQTSLRLVICSGEALATPLQARFFAQFGPQVQLCNLYGPTEASIDVTFWPCQHESREVGVPIGRPIANTQIYLLDGSGQPVPIGVTGEVYLGGVGLARGYIGRPDLTAERFVPHPWSGEPGLRLYRTGDLARNRPDGTLEYVGRMDTQVKLRGFRIELGEIEARLRQHRAVREAVVVVREDRPDDTRLVAYLVLDLLAASTLSQEIQTHSANQPELRERERLLVPQVRQFLQEQLPRHMVPTSFVLLEALPLTRNGKVDRRALLASDEVEVEDEIALGESRTPMEELIVGIWNSVLGRTEVGIHDNFFAIGGHSLLATRLVARVRTRLKVELPVRVVIETPTVAGLARRVEQELRRNSGIELLPLMPVPRPEAIPLSFAQERLWFLDQLHLGSTTYLSPTVLRMLGDASARALERSLEKLVHRHEILRTTFVAHKGQPVQVIQPAKQSVLPFIDLQGLEQETRADVVQVLVRQEARQACNLETGPLLRTYMFRLGGREHVLLLALHHIITDGWSNQVLAHELTTLYQAYGSGQSPELPALPIQYADYALWQRTYLVGEVLQRYLAYWQRQLEGASPLELPTDAPRSTLQTRRGARYSFALFPIFPQSWCHSVGNPGSRCS